MLRDVASRHPEVRCIVLSSAADEFACPAELARHMAASMAASIDKTAALGISINTFQTHRRAIAAKLGVSGAELVRLAAVHNQTR